MSIPCADPELEARYLGSAMSNPETLDRHPVQSTDLWKPSHQTILSAIQSLRAAGKPTNPIATQLELDRHGNLEGAGGSLAVRHIGTVAELQPGPVAERIRELAVLRRYRHAAANITQLCESGTPESVAQAIHEMSMLVTQPDGERYGTLAQAANLAQQEHLSAIEGEGVGVIPTGLAAVDAIVGGLGYGDICVIGGDTSVGKSSTALLAAVAQARAGYKPGIISCEDPMMRWGRRALSLASGVPARALRAGDTTPTQQGRIVSSLRNIETQNIELASCVGSPLSEVIEAARHLIWDKGCKVLVLDYVQCVQVPGIDSRREQVRQVLSQFKHELNRPGVEACGVVLSQYRKRDNEAERPSRSALYEAAYIAQMAEMILLLWKSETGLLCGVLDKSKDSETGQEFALMRDRTTGQLYDPSAEDPNEL